MGRLAVDVAGEMDPTVAVTKTSALRGGWAGKTRSVGRVCLSRQKESGVPSSRWVQRGLCPLCGVWGALKTAGRMGGKESTPKGEAGNAVRGARRWW